MGTERKRARTLVAVATVALLLLAACGDDSDDAASEDRETTPPEGFDEVTTVDDLVGMWIVDEIPGDFFAVFRYDPDGSSAFSGMGRNFDDPDGFGSVELDDGAVTLTVEGGRSCEAGETVVLGQEVSTDGRRLETFVVPSGVDGGCADLAEGTVVAFSRISPESEAGTSITAEVSEDTSRPLSSMTALRGVWLLEGTGQLFYVGAGDAYQLDEAGRIGADPDDAGSVQVGDDRTTLVLTSGPDSRACSEGDLMTWTDVRLADATLSHGLLEDEAFVHGARTTVLQATVSEDECHELTGSTLAWIRLLGG